MQISNFSRLMLAAGVTACAAPASAATYEYTGAHAGGSPVFHVRLTVDAQNTVTAISGTTWGYRIDGLVPAGASFASPNRLYPDGLAGTPNRVDRDGITWYLDFPLGSPWDSNYNGAVFRWQYNAFDGDTQLSVLWGGAPQAYNLSIQGGEISTPVPEPNALLMWCLGLAAGAWRMRQAPSGGAIKPAWRA
jgi:hypothetical protein